MVELNGMTAGLRPALPTAGGLPPVVGCTGNRQGRLVPRLPGKLEQAGRARGARGGPTGLGNTSGRRGDPKERFWPDRLDSSLPLRCPLPNPWG